MSKKIWLDAGHGGSDPGAQGNGWLEKDMNLNVALACRDELEKHGVTVGMTRTTDVFVGLSERAQMANKWGADYFVSEHHNGGGGDRGEVIHSIYVGEGFEMAKHIQDEYLALGQTAVKMYSKAGEGNQDYYAVIRETNMHAIITEGCFVDNAEDMKLFDTKEEQEAEGRAIARGILKLIGITTEVSKPTLEPVPTPPTTPSKEKIDVFYKVFTAEDGWLPEVKNLEDYAGVFGHAIRGLMIRLSSGDVDYKVSTVRSNGYYTTVRNYEDYAGDLKNNVDKVQIFNNKLKYRVRLLNGRWLPFVIGTSDFAGIEGKTIDAIEVEII